MGRVYKSTFRHRLKGAWGGLGGFENSGAGVIVCVRTGEHGSCGEDRGWVEVALLSLCIAGVSVVDTGRGNIVDSRGDLGVGLAGLVGNSVGKRLDQNKKGPR
jgi:hypothetical protein